MNDKPTTKTLACVQSEKEGIIFIQLYEDSTPPSYDLFAYCKLLADQYEGATWFVGDASRYNLNYIPKYHND